MVVAVVVLAGCADPDVDPPDPGTITNTITITETHTVTVTEHVTPPCRVDTPGAICTWAGVGPGWDSLQLEGQPRTESMVYLPSDVGFDPLDGTGWLVEWGNHRIRTVLDDETIVTAVGGWQADGLADEASPLEFRLNFPTRVAFNAKDPGAVYIADFRNHRVERLSDGWVEAVAGVGPYGPHDAEDPDADGVFLASDADLSNVAAVAFDGAGMMYISDAGNHVIRRVKPDGTISVFAGLLGVAGYAGDGGPATAATLFNESSYPFEPAGALAEHDGALYVADTANQVVRRIDLSTGLINTVVGEFVRHPTGVDLTGDALPDIWPGLPGYAGDGGPATEGLLNAPRDIAFGPDGAMYIADTGNHCIRVVRDGIIDTFAGTCTVAGEAEDGPDPLLATLNHPYGVEVDAAGNVFITDTSNHVIRVVWARP